MNDQHDQLSQATDFANCDWQSIVTTLKEPGCSALADAFREVAYHTQSNALRLDRYYCALHLRPESKNGPFPSINPDSLVMRSNISSHK